MVRAVIFDMDGLLVSTEIIGYNLYLEFLEDFGYSLTLEDYAKNYAGKPRKENVRKILDRFCLPVSVEKALEMRNKKDKEILSRHVELKPGVHELLEHLKRKNIKTALATSSDKNRALFILSKHRLQFSFDEMVFGSEVVNGKPDPEIFLKAVEKLNVPRDECLVLEDSEAGILAASNTGIPVICIPDLKEPDERFREKTLAVLPSLPDVINSYI